MESFSKEFNSFDKLNNQAPHLHENFQMTSVFVRVQLKYHVVPEIWSSAPEIRSLGAGNQEADLTNLFLSIYL